ncbi:colorectal mutant cancer protein isoform X1 [Drosophila guanche]|uniref:Blast:Colorectal mutant cancer protein n=2 Tax=Drosophila guanche TaxID=7266 RepID=A0A3B0K4F0_DROGU|nr:colorectal mutant cancer protein isoform X1 [Drosophila guanche]SPP80506.1 blast:Colorectal mutant cancer protein [Drosophila guanche]
MSNDVEIASDAKIGIEVHRRNEKQQHPQREITGISKNAAGSVVGEDIEYVFGSISPRGGCINATKHLVGSYELESPEHTPRDTTESDINISSCSTLDIVNKVEQLSVQQLENRVRELTQRLQQAERHLSESNAEREMCHKRLEVVSQAHECRITEMHCVIAELSKKLRSKQDHIIVEEQEPEGSELSYQEGSVYNSELNLTNPDAECQTEPMEDLYSAASVDKIGLKPQELGNKGQLDALQEEVLHLRAKISLLQSEIATKETAVVEEQTKVDFFAGEQEANESGQRLNDLNACVSLTSPQKRVPAVPKMAERVKLRCASKNEQDEEPTSEAHTELSNEHINLVEHLVCELKEQNSFMDSIMEPLHLSKDMEPHQRKMEYLKMRNTILAMTLDESKEHTEHLYLLCGKYESNAVALQLALNCSDRAIEAYDVMLALLETKLALLIDKSAAAEESRRSVEAVAKHLLARLDSEKNVCENSLGPWQHNINLGGEDDPKSARPWCTDDDNRLRNHVSKLKGRRSTVQHTIVNLESPFSDVYERKRLALEKGHEYKKSPIDLDTAVIMQELLELQDENIELKTKINEAEQDRQHSKDRVAILHVALQQLQLANRVSYSEAEHSALTEQQLVEALTRETELKGRLQTLLGNFTATQRASEEKYEELQQSVRELQQSNHNLGQMLEASRRKYQARVNKLEQRIADLRLDHERCNKHVPETTL